MIITEIIICAMYILEGSKNMEYNYPGVSIQDKLS